MRRFRTHVLALLGAMLLLSLSLSSAFGAHPTHADNRGGAVSAFVHELLFGSDEGTEEEQNEEGEEGEGENEEELSGENADNHGQCVQEYARDHLLVGANDTHGWAVVEAAQVTCRDDGDEEDLEVDEGDEGDDGSATARDRGDRGKSAAAHQKAPGKNKADSARAGGQGHGKANGGQGQARGHGRR